MGHILWTYRTWSNNSTLIPGEIFSQHQCCLVPFKQRNMLYIDGLVLERRNSSALALELRLSCTNSSVSYFAAQWRVIMLGCGLILQNFLLMQLRKLLDSTWSFFYCKYNVKWGRIIPTLCYSSSVICHAYFMLALVDFHLSLVHVGNSLTKPTPNELNAPSPERNSGYFADILKGSLFPKVHLILYISTGSCNEQAASHFLDR